MTLTSYLDAVAQRAEEMQENIKKFGGATDPAMDTILRLVRMLRLLHAAAKTTLVSAPVPQDPIWDHLREALADLDALAKEKTNG